MVWGTEVGAMDRLGFAAMLVVAGCATPRVDRGGPLALGTPLLRVPRDEDEAFEQLLAQCPKPERAGVSAGVVIVAAYLGGCVVAGTSIVVNRIRENRFDGTAVAATIIAAVAAVGEGGELLYGLLHANDGLLSARQHQDEQREHFRYLERPERRALARGVAEECGALPLFEQQFAWGPPPPPPSRPPATIPAAQ
jgi:hypothetical protein